MAEFADCLLLFGRMMMEPPPSLEMEIDSLAMVETSGASEH